MGLVAVALLGGAAAIEHARELRYPAPPVVSEDTLYLTSGSALRRMTVGYNALAADLYWIRLIQYYGNVKLRVAAQASAPSSSAPPSYELLYPLLDLTTTLDPRFNIAYRFGSIFLAEAYPGGAGRPDLALALLEKGLREQPDKWEYMQDAGFVNYWWRHDYQEAARWFKKGSQVKGAAWFLEPLAATTLAEGGDRKSSRVMWEALRQSAELDWVRRDAERRLMQLDALDFIAKAQAIVHQAAAASGRTFGDWGSLARAGIIRGIPIDGTGVPYEIDASGVISVSKSSTLFPLPEEPKRIPDA
jgi:hypothetical protein